MNELQIIVYSETTASTVTGNLGRPEYSYYFILEKYLPVLHSLGNVLLVSNPANEVDELFDRAARKGQSSVFLSFTPPHRTAKGLRCPTVCVLAWEFDCIPYEDWSTDEPWHNWVQAINEIGHVITISDYATKVIRRQVGPGVMVATIPAPVVAPLNWREKFRSVLKSITGGPASRRRKHPFSLTAAIIDTDALNVDVESVTPKRSDPQFQDYEQSVWDGHTIDWHFNSSSESTGQYLVGFYGEESWGCWSKTARPSIILPWSVTGEFELTLRLVAYGVNRGQQLGVRIGDQVKTLVMQPHSETYTLSFSLSSSANSIHFDGVIAASAPGARDHRTLGIGLSRLSMRREGAPEAAEETSVETALDEIALETREQLCLGGTVYTSIFNPQDGRKNWHDMVTAFCWAFRDDPQKTLVLKMSHHNRSAFLGGLWLLFSRLSPFKCRIVAIHGFLTAEEIEALIENTDYFVNTSLAEGQCLPLLEFMARGVPAISPNHTAMESYISPENAFIVKSGVQPHIWPNDPRRAYRTLSHRIDWYSLRQAYLDSAALLNFEPARYAGMSRSALRTVYDKYSTDRIARDLKLTLASVAGSGE